MREYKGERLKKIKESSGRVFCNHQALEGYGYTDAKLRVPEWLVRIASVDFFATVTAVEYQGSQLAADELATAACLRGFCGDNATYGG